MTRVLRDSWTGTLSLKLSVNFTEFIKFETHSKLPLNFTEFLKFTEFTELLVISTEFFNLVLEESSKFTIEGPG